MTEPTDDLRQRCAEVVEWQRTGVLPGDALRNYAAAHWAGLHDSLQMAERDTSAQAMQWIAKWGTPPAVVGEPVAWLSTDSIGERYLCFTKPKDSDPVRPLVFGDTTPQPTQADSQPAATVIKNGANRQWMSERLGHLPDGIYSLYLAPPAQVADSVPKANSEQKDQ